VKSKAAASAAKSTSLAKKLATQTAAKAAVKKVAKVAVRKPVDKTKAGKTVPQASPKKKVTSIASATSKSAGAKSVPSKSMPSKSAAGKVTGQKMSSKQGVDKRAASAKAKKTSAVLTKTKTAATTTRTPAASAKSKNKTVQPVRKPIAKGAGQAAAKSLSPAAARKAEAAGHSMTAPAALSAYLMPHRVINFSHPVPVKKNPRLANNWKTKPIEQWSDEEVIAMPDEEYMNNKQLAFFRLRLLTLKEDLLSNAGETTENLRGDTVVVPDPADRATIEEEHALELRTRDRERKLLKKIEQSIARIDAGDYGYCDETGEPIGIARLLARPTATLSLEAQQRRELKQKLFGD